MSSNNPHCPQTQTPSQCSGTPSAKSATLEQDKPCVDNADAMSKMGGSAAGDGLPANAESQTRSESGSSPSNPNSCTSAQSPRASIHEGGGYAEGSCVDDLRNPITGCGLNGDGVGGWKPKKQKQREGNPVTGEGYTGPVNVPGVHPVVNKNRVPPGGFSSGLW